MLQERNLGIFSSLNNGAMKRMALSDVKDSKLTKEDCIRKYNECKSSKSGGIPERDEFLSFAGIPAGQLQRVFGPSPYSKLQAVAGDTPNKWQLERTPLDKIMRLRRTC